MTVDEIKDAIRAHCSGGDVDVVDYVASIISDDDFEWGIDCIDACEALGPFMVDGGLVSSDEAAHGLCRKLYSILQQGSEDMKKTNSFRALEKAVVLEEMNSFSSLQVTENQHEKSGRQLIQGVFREGDDDSFSLMTEKDALKIKKQHEKKELAQRQAFEALQSLAENALTGKALTVVRHQGGPPVRDIHIESFSVSNGGAELVTDASLTLAFGRHYGLVGRNGVGKSTFLRALASGSTPGIPSNCQIVHVEQEIIGDDTPVVETLLNCDAERTALLQEEHELLGGSGDLDRLQKVTQRLIDIDADGAPAKASRILSGLGFDDGMQKRATKTFSGGWRMRIALARALFVEPDLLLLDEPTNHLDLHAVIWLEQYLCRWKKTLLVVSHARDFLNAVCSDIIHLHSKKLTAYRGNYDVFQKTAAERVRNARAAAESNELKRAHVEAFINRFRYNANRAKLVQSRIKALERMDPVEVIENDAEYSFEFPCPSDGAVSGGGIACTDVEFQYSPHSPILFRNINFGIDTESRIALVGANGAGKTTFMKLLSGELEPTKGHIYRNPALRIATFQQHFVDSLDLALTPLGFFTKEFPDVKEPDLRSHLSRFGISADLAGQTLYTLSGGQKSRVALAHITFKKPHILFLDEPSNHLDMESIDALALGLSLFKGGVVIISHDQALIDMSVERLWAMEDGTLRALDCSFEAYKKELSKLHNHVV